MQNLTRKWVCAGLMLGCLGLSGCLTLKVGAKSEPPQIKARGLVNAHFTATGFEPYGGHVLKAGLFGDSNRAGEIVSLDVWPIAGVGVGLVGARVRLLPLEMGVGVLGYDPKPVVKVVDEQKKEATAEPQEPAQSR